MKDAYWFQHDSNAKDDPKCILLIEQLGLEGYGIFWVLVETLRDQPQYRYPLSLIPALARRFNTTADKMNVVVSRYGLFEVEEGEFFYSNSLRQRMEYMDYKRQIAQAAGKKSAEKRLKLNAGSTDVQPTLNDRSTNTIQYNTVQNNTKENNINNLDTALSDFKEFRKKIKKPLTDKGLQLLIKKLDKLAESDDLKIEILNQSILNCWQGIWPLKENVAKVVSVIGGNKTDTGTSILKGIDKSKFLANTGTEL